MIFQVQEKGCKGQVSLLSQGHSCLNKFLKSS